MNAGLAAGTEAGTTAAGTEAPATGQGRTAGRWVRAIRRPGSLLPPSWRSLPDRRRRRLLILGLAVLCFVPLLLASPGRFVADTKLPVWTATSRYVVNSLKVWQESPYLGNEQHDGILFPMAAVVAVLRATGLPLWVVERLWHGLLLFLAAWGMVVLVDTVWSRRPGMAHGVAAVAYALNPYTLGFGVHGSAVFLPYALLPLLLAVWIRGLRRPAGWAWPALVALVFFCMGGGNGAPQVYTLIPLVAYLLWAVFVERTVGLGQALAFGLKAAVLAVAINLYWLVGLTTQGVSNDIAFSEQPNVINVTSSFSENLRLLGFWGFYGFDRFGPWYPAMQRFLGSPLLTLGSFALPAAAFLGAWRSRWRMRALFVLLAVLGVVVMAGIYPVHDPTPFGRALRSAYASVPGFSGLRTTYKFGATLALATALLAGVAAAGAWTWLRRTGAWKRAGVAVLAVVLLGLVADAYPLWRGNLYPRFRTMTGIPAYWTQAVRSIERGVGQGRAFFAPGGLFTYYAWGGPGGGIAEATPQLRSVRRAAIPVMERYGSNLLAAVEQPYQLGPRVPGATAALLRRLGVTLVVVQNDVNFARSNTARPSDMLVLSAEPGLGREASFGRPGQFVPGSGPTGPKDRRLAAAEHRLPPIEVLRVADPAPVLRAESGPPLVVSGDGFGLPSVVAAGLLGKDQPFLYSGTLRPADLEAMASEGPSFVVTDSNRRRQWTFSGVRLNASYTLPAGEGGPRVGYNLFGGRLDTQSVATLDGAAAVSASAYGSAFEQQPWFRPALAFDADPATAWTVNGLGVEGQWVRIDLERPLTVGQVTLTPYQGQPGTRSVASANLEFSDGTVVSRPVARTPTTVAFVPRRVSWLRVRITGVRTGLFGGPVGFREISVPGVRVRESVRVPTDLFDAASRTSTGRALMDVAPLSYVFRRSGGGPVPDEERGIDRIFTAPAERSFELSGGVRLDPAAPDQDLDLLLRGPSDVIASSSGRAGNSAAARASLALDGNPATGWTAAGTKGQWMQAKFPPHQVGGLSLRTFTDRAHSQVTSVRLDLSDGTSLVRTVPGSGLLKVAFSPRNLRSVRVTVLSAGVDASLGGTRPPAGIAELSIPGVSVPSPPPPGTPLPCYRGGGVRLDGHRLAVRVAGAARGLLRGRTLPLATCDGKLVRLQPGEHHLVVSGVLQPSSVSLESPNAKPAPAAAGSAREPGAAGPSLRVTSTISGYRVAVSGASAPFYLVLGQNASTGWRASIGGRAFPRSLVLDGYSAGWRVDRTGDFTVEIAYAAQARQNLAYVVSAAALPVVLVLVVVGWRRRRFDPVPAAVASPRTPRGSDPDGEPRPSDGEPRRAGGRLGPPRRFGGPHRLRGLRRWLHRATRPVRHLVSRRRRW